MIYISPSAVLIALIAFLIYIDSTYIFHRVVSREYPWQNQSTIRFRLKQLGKSQERDYENFRIAQMTLITVALASMSILYFLMLLNIFGALILSLFTALIIILITERNLTQRVKKKKEVIITWVEKTLIPQLDKFADAITEDEVNKYLETRKIPVPEAGPEGGYKVGDTVVYKREKFVQEEWDKVTDDEKKKPNEGKMKELQTEQIGIKKISKIEGDKISFEGADFTKTMGDLLMKSEVEAEGQEDLVKKLGDLKTKKPEDIKKVGTYVDFISDEANKDKVAEIDKIIGGGEAAA